MLSNGVSLPLFQTSRITGSIVIDIVQAFVFSPGSPFSAFSAQTIFCRCGTVAVRRPASMQITRGMTGRYYSMPDKSVVSHDQRVLVRVEKEVV